MSPAVFELFSDFSIEREDQDVYEGPRRQCTINGLQPGEKYLLKLLATNKAGVSFLVFFIPYHILLNIFRNQM